MQPIHSLNEVRMPAGCAGIHALKRSAVAILTVIFNSIYKDARATNRTAADGPQRPESTPRSIAATPCTPARSRRREPVPDQNEEVCAHSRRDGEPLAKNAAAFQSSCAFTRSYINKLLDRPSCLAAGVRDGPPVQEDPSAHPRFHAL